jgi:diguanylate cyclase (GGDEF)-like protein
VIGPNVGSCGSAAWSGELTRADDIATDPRWVPIRELAASASLGHCWSNPIKSPDGDVLGTLAFYGPQPREPLPEHLEMLDEWARVAGIAIERHRTLERLVHDAHHDGLTGLLNRRAIFEALEQAIVRAGAESELALLFIDLDGLKALNDTLGHDRADEMLREVAERLSASVRDNDFVGRFGGDEFIVIAEGIDEEQAGELSLRLLDAISEPLPGLEQISVTASIGIAQLHSSSVDAREAIRQADGAMYAAKRAGRDRCVFVEGKQRVREGRRLMIARELRGAEMRGEMHLVYQPVFDLRDDEIVGVEALLRWSNPRLGDVAPMEFIPVAEDTGTILPIGAWVLRESCEAIAQLATKLDRKLELSVNVSAHQLSNPSFAHWVTQTIAHAELPPEQLTLEITESALMRPTATTKRTLHELASNGIRIVLDDFGTGFSSISWLKEHPLGAIKIDRDFIAGLPRDPRDSAIVAAMLEMGAALGCTVTAEGVETEGQLAALRELGCERTQGFLLARPVPLSELQAKLGAGAAVREPR